MGFKSPQGFLRPLKGFQGSSKVSKVSRGSLTFWRPIGSTVNTSNLVIIMFFFQTRVNNNLNLLERMSCSTTSGTSIRTAATRDRHSPVLGSPRMPKIRQIPVMHKIQNQHHHLGQHQPPSIVDDRSITEMSIHDMQILHQPEMLSRSLSESDLSEICGNIGGATGSSDDHEQEPMIHMMAPSDDDDNTGRDYLTVLFFQSLPELNVAF